MSGSYTSSSDNAQASQATTPTWQATYQPSALTGYSSTAAGQTGGIESKPSWMTGVWDADWWGKNASTGQTMSNADLAPKNNNSLLEAVYNQGAFTNSPQNTATTTNENDWDKWKRLLAQNKEDTLTKSRNQSLFGKQNANWSDYFAQ
jgi:hypothetical protein